MKNKRNKTLRQEGGITLISLVVTIVVLLILAGITISYVLGENGIINMAKRAKEITNDKIKDEHDQINELNKWLTENSWQTEEEKPDTPVIPNKSLNLCVKKEGDWANAERLYAYFYSDDGNEKYAFPGLQFTMSSDNVFHLTLSDIMSVDGCNVVLHNGGDSLSTATIRTRTLELPKEGGTYTFKKSDIISVYFENSNNWDEVYVYAWGDTETLGVWPGNRMALIDAENSIWYYTFGNEVNEYDGIIFNDNTGKNQTNDFVFSANSIYSPDQTIKGKIIEGNWE